MAAYLIADVHRTDVEQAARYSARSGPSVERHGGHYLARGGTTVTLEGGWEPDRLVVIEFETVEAARAWYDSEDYREIRTLREGAGEWRMVIVDGIANPAAAVADAGFEAAD